MSCSGKAFNQDEEKAMLRDLLSGFSVIICRQSMLDYNLYYNATNVDCGSHYNASESMLQCNQSWNGKPGSAHTFGRFNEIVSVAFDNGF